MESDKQLVLPERAAPEAIQPVTPMQMVQIAVQQGASIDTIERLAKLQNEMVEREEVRAFNDAMMKCQAALRRIGADKANKQTNSRYASYAKLDSILRPIYTKYGFALSFDTGEIALSDYVLVVCYVSHNGGHTRTYKINMPADGKGAKGGDVMTKTHATGSAVMYGRRYLLNMIFNTSIGETDDDGNAASMAGDELGDLLEIIGNSSTIGELQAAYDEAKKVALKAKDGGAMNRIVAAKDARKKELQ